MNSTDFADFPLNRIRTAYNCSVRDGPVCNVSFKQTPLDLLEASKAIQILRTSQYCVLCVVVFVYKVVVIVVIKSFVICSACCLS